MPTHQARRAPQHCPTRATAMFSVFPCLEILCCSSSSNANIHFNTLHPPLRTGCQRFAARRRRPARTCVGVLSAPPSPMYPVSSRRTSYTTPLSPVPLVEASSGFADDIAFRAVRGARRSGQKKHSTSDRVQARQCCNSSALIAAGTVAEKKLIWRPQDGELLPALLEVHVDDQLACLLRGRCTSAQSACHSFI